VTGGWFTILRVKGVPLRAHWSFLVPFVLALGAPTASLCWLVIVVGHELGHALLVRRFRGDVLGIDVWLLGGFCRWRGETTKLERSLIAWGGVLVQLVMLAVAELAVAFGPPGGALASEASAMFIGYNGLIIGLNLLPFHFLDGGEAWKVIPYSLEWTVDRFRARKLRKNEQGLQAELNALNKRKSVDSRFDIN